MARPTPELADLCFVHTTGTVGDLIRSGEGLIAAIDRLRYPHQAMYWNHVAIYIGQKAVTDHGWLVEAQPGGVRAVPADHYDPRKISWSTGWFPDLTTAQRINIAEIAESYARTKNRYGFEDYAAIAAHTLHLPVPWLRDFIESDRSMICSQLVDKCYQLGGVQLFKDGRWPGFVTPMDLYALKVGAHP